MLPLFFGARRRRLFGVYEPAARRGGVARAALLCNTWGDEYVNAHRAVRFLARRLGVAGFDTFRFDYYGSGDSGGETTDADLGGWKSDIVTAVRELKEMSDAPRVVLVGLRLGATLVAEAVPNLHADIDGIILWDPIVNGLNYVRELLLRDEQMDELSAPTMVSEGVDAVSELDGLSVSPAFISGLKAIDLCSPELQLPAKTLTIFTMDPLLDRDVMSLERKCFSDRNAEVAMIDGLSPWQGNEVLPVEVCERILLWLR